jgi:ribosome biogenesis ATPase
VNQLLTEMDGMEDRKGIFIIGATNRPDIIDPAMLRPGRLEKMMYVPLPSSDDTLAIMKTITRKLPLDSDVNLEEINKQIDGFSGADVAALVREAQLNSLKRLYKVSFNDYKNIVNDCPSKNEQEEKFKIINEDFVLALKTTYRSVSKEDRVKYEHIRMKIQQSRDK